MQKKAEVGSQVVPDDLRTTNWIFLLSTEDKTFIAIFFHYYRSPT